MTKENKTEEKAVSEVNQNYVDIVLSGFSAEKNDDEILKELFTAGVEFSDLRSVFNTIVQENGLRMSAKDRKAKVEEILADWVPSTAEDLLAKVSEISDKTKSTAAKALASIKAFAKANELELPKIARGVTASKVGFSGKMRVILDYVLENRDVTREKLAAFCETNSIPVNYVGSAMNIMHFAKQWAGEVSAEEQKEAA